MSEEPEGAQRGFRLSEEEDLHDHLTRMVQRGITSRDTERTVNEGWSASDTKPGTLGRVFVFPYGAEWEGRFYEEKEVTVYYKRAGGRVVLLTARARYGKNLPGG